MYYYVPSVEIKDFNVLINGKSFFDLPVKNEEKAYEKIIETGVLLDFANFKEKYRLIETDFSKQTKLKDPQQINFIGKPENQAHGATIFLSSKNQKKLLLNFCKIL